MTLVWRNNDPSLVSMQDPRASTVPGKSNSMTLEAPIVALGLLKHLPKGALPLPSLLVLFLDPKRNLHHAARDVPIAPQGFDSLVIVARARGLVEQWPPGILVLAHQLNLFQRILWLPFLDLLPNLADRSLGGDGHCKHAKRGEHLHFGHVVLVALCDLCSPLLDEATLLIPDLPVGSCVLGEDNLLAFLLSHGSHAEEPRKIGDARQGVSQNGLSQNGYGSHPRSP